MCNDRVVYLIIVYLIIVYLIIVYLIIAIRSRASFVRVGRARVGRAARRAGAGGVHPDVAQGELPGRRVGAEGGAEEGERGGVERRPLDAHGAAFTFALGVASAFASVLGGSTFSLPPPHPTPITRASKTA